MIFSVIAISIYSAFNAGIFAWKRLSAVSDSYQQPLYFLDFMADNIASYVPSSKVKFKGQNDRIEFLGKVKNGDNYALAKIYFFFENNALVYKEEIGEDVITEQLINNLKSAVFKYYVKKPGPESPENKYEWFDFFNPDEDMICSAVSVTISSDIELKKVIPLRVEVVGVKASSP